VRGCGLKHELRRSPSNQSEVTRRARVWIETDTILSIYRKLQVTRRARVWIETIENLSSYCPQNVTRRARVWIETLKDY